MQGVNYTGTHAVTDTGIPCIAWEDQTVNDFITEASFTNKVYPKNYCRNPMWMFNTREDRPWCYIAESNPIFYGYCDIPMCVFGCP